MGKAVALRAGRNDSHLLQTYQTRNNLWKRQMVASQRKSNLCRRRLPGWWQPCIQQVHLMKMRGRMKRIDPVPVRNPVRDLVLDIVRDPGQTGGTMARRRMVRKRRITIPMILLQRMMVDRAVRKRKRNHLGSDRRHLPDSPGSRLRGQRGPLARQT